MPGLGTRDNRGERPYVINYVRGGRVLSDSAPTLNAALARISVRLAKRHNKGEQAQVYLHGVLVYDTSNKDHAPTLGIEAYNARGDGGPVAERPHYPPYFFDL